LITLPPPRIRMALLRFDNVSKAYPGSAPALSEVSFAVEEGEMLFVTGHSGAGKSTRAAPGAPCPSGRAAAPCW